MAWTSNNNNNSTDQKNEIGARNPGYRIQYWTWRSSEGSLSSNIFFVGDPAKAPSPPIFFLLSKDELPCLSTLKQSMPRRSCLIHQIYFKVLSQ
jgi:hypothetical protein